MFLRDDLMADLANVDEAAACLPWSGSRGSWLSEHAVHLEDEATIVAVDLHGLTVQLVDEVLDAVGANCCGRPIRLIHGRGSHRNGYAVLREHVRSEVELRGFQTWSRCEGHIDVVP